MTQNTGTLVPSALVPLDSADQYPTHKAGYGQGGWRTVADLTALGNIPASRREEGMIAWVQSEQAAYRLAADLSTWDQALFFAENRVDYLSGTGATLNFTMPFLLTDKNLLTIVVTEDDPTSFTATTTSASTTVTSANQLFRASDVGKSITGTGIPANTVIRAVTNSTTVTLGDSLGNVVNASASGTVTLSLTRSRSYVVPRSGYSVAGTTLTFTSIAPGSGTNNIEVTTINPAPAGYADPENFYSKAEVDAKVNNVAADLNSFLQANGYGIGVQGDLAIVGRFNLNTTGATETLRLNAVLASALYKYDAPIGGGNLQVEYRKSADTDSVALAFGTDANIKAWMGLIGEAEFGAWVKDGSGSRKSFGLEDATGILKILEGLKVGGNTSAITGIQYGTWTPAFSAAGGGTFLYASGSTRSVADGVTTSGSTTLTSATAVFTSTDTGHVIAGSGIPANTTMTFVNATTVTLSAPATATASGVTLTIGGTLQQFGNYLRLNEWVIATFNVQAATTCAITSSGDTLEISGLPFPRLAANGTPYGVFTIDGTLGANLVSANGNLRGTVLSGASKVTAVYQSPTTGTDGIQNETFVSITTNTICSGSIIYRADSATFPENL